MIETIRLVYFVKTRNEEPLMITLPTLRSISQCNVLRLKSVALSLQWYKLKKSKNCEVLSVLSKVLISGSSREGYLHIYATI